MSNVLDYSFAGNDTGRYEPEACPRCGERPQVEWVEVSTFAEPDRWMPSHGLCQTPGCVDEKGRNMVHLAPVRRNLDA
jgi:hypothetical protein